MGKFRHFVFGKPQRIAMVTAVVIGLVFFQNCTDARLIFPRLKTNSGFGEFSSTFPLPFSQAQQARIVFFVDMSISMVHGLCPSDLAADSLDLVTDCTAKPGVRIGDGVDAPGYRMDVMTKWIQEINSNAANPGAVKYLIVPFNGGTALESSRGDLLSFTDASTALSIVAELKREQTDSINFYTTLQDNPGMFSETGSVGQPNQVDPAFKLGVTTAIDRLKTLRNLLQTEATALGSQSYRSTFEIVMFSDGVPKPRATHVKKGIRQFWTMGNYGSCITACGPDADNFIDGYLSEYEISNCSAYVNTSNGNTSVGCFWQAPTWINNNAGETTGVAGTGTDFLQKAKTLWGDWLANTPNKIATLAKDVKIVLDSFGNVDSRLSLLWLDPTRISPEVSNDSENWMLRIKSQKTADRFRFLTNPVPPFSLLNQGAELESYRISGIYILNPFLKFDSSGNPLLDSDGDGMPDTQELALGLDPHNPRSNGRCLDSLTAQGLCPTTITCNPKWDADGDGLNECEELILNTNPRDFDSDGDGLPDSIEWLYGFDPVDDDGTVISNIFKGLGPDTSPSSVDPRQLLDYTVAFQGYTQQSSGQPRTGIYQIKVNTLPLATTLSSVGSPLYYSQTPSAAHQVPMLLTGEPHAQNETPVMVLVRIENELHNGDVHWGYMKYVLQATATQTIKVDLGQMKYLKVLDPQEDK